MMRRTTYTIRKWHGSNPSKIYTTDYYKKVKNWLCKLMLLLRQKTIVVKFLCKLFLIILWLKQYIKGVVKNPVVPDQASRAKLQEKQSSLTSEKYEDYINLGVEEWEKTYKELEPMGKKSILFIMTDDTKNCDDVAEFLEKSYPQLKGAVLTIHTNKSGEISETVTGKKEKELQDLRKKANEIDSIESPYKVIVSVLMLKEGWDVKNVTTIVGLRPYGSDSKILPEQTLGRGLRRMFFGRDDVEEYVSVIGTPAFMDFVESIKAEGVEF